MPGSAAGKIEAGPVELKTFLAAECADCADSIRVIRTIRGLLSEDILQCELHDSGIPRCGDHAESVGIEVCRGVPWSKTVGYVKSFGSNLESLGFAELESPRKGHIELPGPGPLHIARAHVSVPAIGRLRECARVQIVRQR